MYTIATTGTYKYTIKVDSVVQVGTVLLTSELGSSIRGERHYS